MTFQERYHYNSKTDLLGKGGFARVYKAFDTILEREVALKIFSAGISQKYDLISEIKRAIKLEHPNLCRYYDVAFVESTNAFGEEEKHQIGVMEYLEGGNIKTYLKCHPASFNHLLLDVLKGLGFLHKKGIIHRDLKPQNILIKITEDGPVAKIIDFGISKELGKSKTSSSALIGTIEYMAPEQFNPRKFGSDGKIGTNIDLWSFGVMLYELVRGESLFGSIEQNDSTWQVMSNILDEERLNEKVRDLPHPYFEIVNLCLIKEAVKRCNYCEQLMKILMGRHTADSIPVFESEWTMQSKDLWKNLPSDETDRYWKPDVSQIAVTLGGNRFVAASKRGRSHAHEGKFRDDEFDFIFLEETGWAVIVLSDGEGSAKSSRKGSLLACDAVLDYFVGEIGPEEWSEIDNIVTIFNQNKNEENSKALSHLLIGNLSKAAFFVHKTIEDYALKKEVPAKDFATTLLFSVVKKFDFGYCIASFGVGDGGIGIFDVIKKTAHLLTLPDGGEYAGQSRYITMPEIFKDDAYFKRFSIKVVPDFTALVLMTDGITDPKFQTSANLNEVEKWQQLWDDLNGSNEDKVKVDFTKDNEELATQLSSWLDFWSPGNHDDRTIAILF